MTRRLTLLLIAASLSLPACRPPDKADRAVESAKTVEAPVTEGGQDFRTLDFTKLPSDLGEAMKVIRASQTWPKHDEVRKGKQAQGDPREWMDLRMNRELLGASFDAGSKFLMKWQLPEGNFRYMFDWMDGTWVEDDHQVRQAGTLWGISTNNRYHPSAEQRAVLDKGLKFWFDRTIPGPAEGTLFMKYPGDPRIDSGTVALVALAIVEYLKTDAPMDDAWRAEITSKLDGYLKYLQWMQMPNGHISKRYDHRKERKARGSSPYYDGESLLALTKAARELGRDDLVPTIEKAAAGMLRTYTIKAWAKDRDSKQTKGFYQWSSMSFVEYYLAKWKDYEVYGDAAIALGWWMTHTHRTLSRHRNHAYAIEGLISAWRVANLRGDYEASADLLFTLDRSLYKLGQWQIGGPLASKNKFLKKQDKFDDMASGGVMNARKPSKQPVRKDVAHQLRIDVTQHQMHATTLALEEVYK